MEEIPMIDNLPRWVSINPDAHEVRNYIELMLQWGHDITTEHNALTAKVVTLVSEFEFRRQAFMTNLELHEKVRDLEDRVAELALAVEQLEAAE